MTNSDNKQVESDLDRARERLSFYEQFDEIIKQNIASSSALLKEASASFDNDFTEERRKYRSLLSDILDDLTALQAQSERLARRVHNALDELENTLPSQADVGTSLSAPAGLAAEAPPEAVAIVQPNPKSTRKKGERSKPAPPADATEPEKTVAPTRATPPAATAPVVVVPPTEPTSTNLLVHGVSRASAALALKSYIEKLEFVSAVEPREFAAGLLRLQVESTRPLTIEDLSGWPLADRVELKNASNGLLELGLTPA